MSVTGSMGTSCHAPGKQVKPATPDSDSSSNEDTKKTIVKQVKKTAKMKAPDQFSGRNDDLERFITQCNVYAYANKKDLKDTNQVVFFTSYLTGKAYEWIEPHLNSFIDPDENKVTTVDTDMIFESWAGFCAAIRRIFGDQDPARKAEREILGLEQNGRAANYAAEFSIRLARLNWDEEAKKTIFRKGLNASIKDEMM